MQIKPEPRPYSPISFCSDAEGVLKFGDGSPLLPCRRRGAGCIDLIKNERGYHRRPIARILVPEMLNVGHITRCPTISASESRSVQRLRRVAGEIMPKP